MNNLIKILSLAKAYRKYAFLNIVFNLLSVIFSLFSLAMIAPFLRLLFISSSADYDATLASGPSKWAVGVESVIHNINYYLTRIIVDEGKREALVMICILVVVMILLKNLFKYLALYFLAPLRNGVVRDLRSSLFDKILRLPLSYYSDQRKGDLMSRFTVDVQEIEWSVMTGIEMIFRDPVNIIVFLGSMIVLSPKLTMFVFILLPVTGLIIGTIGKRLRKHSEEVKSMMGSILSITEETMSGIRVILGFNAQKPASEKFRSENEQYTSKMIGVYRKTDLSSPLSEFLGTLVLVVVMYFGGMLVLGHDPSLSPEGFITYMALFSQLIAPAKAITTAYYNVQKGAASADRIYRIMDEPEVIHDKDSTIPMKNFNHSIRYNKVNFSYRKDQDHLLVLKDVDLEIKKGETVALVGQSGSGKSTLADLLPRFYDVDSGTIEIDGHNVKDLSLSDIRNLLGIVTQEPLLFNDSIFKNVALGFPGATIQDIENACRIANAHEFIEKMKDGYYTNIGDRGNKLSGGQKQRLSIARAVLKNPPILILDEATSALDSESERLVQDAITRLMHNRTSIIIAHRLSTIQHADKIIVMSQGRIVEQGKHQELLQRDGVYKRLYEMQSFN